MLKDKLESVKTKINSTSPKFKIMITAISFFGIISAFIATQEITFAQFVGNICGGSDGIPDQLKTTVKNLLTFLLALVFVIALVKVVQQAFESVREDKEIDFFDSNALKSAVILPIGLLVIQWAISAVFQADISCLMPWS